MLKAYKYRIYPNNEQKELLDKHFGSTRFLYNYFLGKRIEYYEKHKEDKKKGLTYNDNAKELTLMKKLKDYEWLNEVNSQSLQQSLKHLDTAYKNFFRKNKVNGFPKFKSRKNRQSFNIIMTNNNLKVDFEKEIIKIPKFKDGIKTVFHRIFAGKVRQATISKTKTDKYFVSILVDTLTEKPKKKEIKETTSVGIDLGIKDFAILSTGEKIQNPKYLNKSEKQLRKLQRQVSKKKKGSNNRKKAVFKLAKQHEKVYNQRNDFLNKVSYAITKRFDTIIIEDLAVKNMTKNKRLSKLINDVSWSKFTTQLEYKSLWKGKNLLKIDRWYPSSKTCSHCNYIFKELKLSNRVWVCPNCGTKHDRDINASKNIHKNGLLQTVGAVRSEQYKNTPADYALSGSQYLFFENR
jgi:putative transposase